jgi:undecaprenyl-diphosphatase
MALWFAALMGLVQGLTEYIPVSSTAHLRILPALFGQPDKWGAEYTAVIQLGTLAAVIIYFAKDLVAVSGAMFRDPSSPDGRLPWLLAVGTVPIVIAGLLLKKHVETDLRSLYIVGAALIVVGVAMWAIDAHAEHRDGVRPLASFTLTDALLVGLAQTLALVPGVSRSGATICMALLLGLTRSDAARFSFLLSIPAVAGAGLLEAPAAFRKLTAEMGSQAVPAIAIGITVAGVVGYATIAWLMRWLGSHQLVGFAIYRIAGGIALLGAIAAGLISAT